MSSDKPTKKRVKPSGTVYPNPAALITSRGVTGRTNIFTAAWVSTVSMTPPHLGVAIRPVRFSFPLIIESGEFGVNLPTSDMVRDVDKWDLTGFTREEASEISVPLIVECPVNIECRVVEKVEIGTHFWIIGKVVARHEVEDFSPGNLLSYVSPDYRSVGKERLGFYGFSRR